MEMSWFLIERLPGLETSPFPNGGRPSSRRSFETTVGNARETKRKERKGKEEGYIGNIRGGPVGQDGRDAWNRTARMSKAKGANTSETSHDLDFTGATLFQVS